MAFQEFGGLSERRRAERQQKLRKRIAIGAVSTLILLLLVACGFFALGYQSKHVTGTKSSDVTQPKKETLESIKAVKMVCSSTDYKNTCETSLTKAVSNSSPSEQLHPKELLRAAISVIADEVTKSINRTEKIKVNDKELRGAIQDCRELLGYALDDLETSLANVDKHEDKSVSHDLKIWLSASLTYQQTCIDGFPEGKLKTKMEESMVTAKEMNSNALAIVDEVASVMKMLGLPGFDRRHLLDEKENHPNGTHLPNWMTAGDRRLLKQAAAGNPEPDIVVAKDGSGGYKTINEALEKIPKDRKGRYVIYVKEGIYDETVILDKNMANITMYGDGSRKTIITGNKNFVDGTRTFQTATFAAIGDGFIAKNIGFRNTAGAIKHQAVALRVQSDRSIFLNCRMEGYQDTLYAQTHRQFYRGCVICGTIDFIFGDAAAVFQNCMIVVRQPLDNQQNIVTAQGRLDKRATTGTVIQNCRIIPDKKLVPLKGKIRSYLGRPWKEYSRTIFMESTIDDLIHPDGWMEWEGDFGLKTLVYGEYNNKGPGAGLAARVKWPGYMRITKEEAIKYTAANFIDGESWIKSTDTPVHLGLYT
ncbi:putative pectinesterase/pectinesterase inhibitor 45 [Aristolochia californica]|uniref:putative pectinesterase/pectinesterase inhibitor 45 n=1 Tax=Aristolochia californica TaxID=171875 RepID=UPI0035E23865